MIPRDLVCASCWRDLFDTEAFEQTCTSDQYNGITVTTAVRDIKYTGCTWCEHTRSFIGDRRPPGDSVTIHLTPISMSPCRPEGRNIFYLSIDYHSLSGGPNSGWALRLHAWTAPDDPASGYVTARPLRTDVDSEAATMQLRTWLNECTGHECCKHSREASVLPTRVIEISPPGQQHPRLLEPGNMHGIYATLSYCWGSEPFSTLTRSNENELMKELDPLTLPPTFSDAIVTARRLSIPYLWIDALCIVQDSEEDKARELANMKRIYASSTLTIVAASAKNVFEGLFHPRFDLEPSYTIPFRLRPGVFGTMSVNEMDAICYDERFEPLARRAWAMQEQMLAQRTLTFTSRTIMWRCSAGTRNFGDSLYFPHDLGSGYNENDVKYSLNLHSLLLSEQEACAQKDKALSCWLRVVTSYSLRSASLERDKLNAIAGVASHPSFVRSLGSRYFAGLWQYELARQLVWCTSRNHRTLPETGVVIYRPAEYRAPSWSWASVEGGVVRYDYSFDDEDEPLPDVVCDIVDCSTVLKFPNLNAFGEVLSGMLKIKAPARKAWFNPATRNIFLLPLLAPVIPGRENLYDEEYLDIAKASGRYLDDFEKKYPDVYLEADPELAAGTSYRNMCGRHDETGNHGPVIVMCVAIIMNKGKDDGVEGLLLLQNEVNRSDSTFRRIGYFDLGRNLDFPKETETDISIV